MPSTAELAASAIEMWQGLGGSRRRSHVTFQNAAADVEVVAARLHEAEREVETLRHVIQQDQRRIVKEVRAMRTSWEGADARAQTFEKQTLILRCAEATLTREVAHADGLTDWWRKQEASGRDLIDKLQADLKAAGKKSGGLETSLARCAADEMRRTHAAHPAHPALALPRSPHTHATHTHTLAR